MLKNKVALVTGASSGIGREIALVWAREGAKVVASDLNVEAGQETVAMVRALGADAIFVPSDVGKPSDAEALVAKAVAHYGRLDVTCNNAGIAGESYLMADYPPDEWAQIINVNLSGVFYGMKYQIAAMLKTGGGSIINIASILGTVGVGEAAAYVASKHGVVGLTKAAAIEYSALGIRVNAVAPGFIVTPMIIEKLEEDPEKKEQLLAAHPIGRMGRPAEVAELVTWLASDRASFVTGGYYPVDGGYLAQ